MVFTAALEVKVVLPTRGIVLRGRRVGPRSASGVDRLSIAISWQAVQQQTAVKERYGSNVRLAGDLMLYVRHSTAHFLDCSTCARQTFLGSAD